MNGLIYYNELEKYPAEWLRNLINQGHIADGYVDQRDIREVKAVDLKQYKQAHFFAGIGTWSYALRLAGWTDDREVWTGSCPCQPFSTAGSQRGTDDPRHLWPDWFRLVQECRPAVIFGEQVASKDGLAWLDIVYGDLEGEGYAVAAVDLCATSAQAPHIRQRLYFVANTESSEGRLPIQQWEPREESIKSFGCSETGELGDTGRASPARFGQYGWKTTEEERLFPRPCINGQLGDTKRNRNEAHNLPAGQSDIIGRSAINPWSGCEWIPCRETDGTIKYRPTEPGLFPLADGSPQRMGRLRAYGNAIVAPLAAEFIRAYMEVITT